MQKNERGPGPIRMGVHYAGVCLLVLVAVPWLVEWACVCYTGRSLVANADVLGYYGAFVSTVVSVWMTIAFTRKQIAREQYLHAEREKWEKIEAEFSEMVEGVHPLHFISLFTEKAAEKDTGWLHPEFELIQNTARIRLDSLEGGLPPEDMEKVSGLVADLEAILTETERISGEMMRVLPALRAYNTNRESMKTFDRRDWDKKCADERTAQMRAAKKLQEDQYAALLRKKRACFDGIYEEIDRQAGRMLGGK